MSGNNYADMDWLDRRYRENKALMRAAAQAEMDEMFKRESMVQQAAIGNRAERRKHAAINRKADGNG